MESEAISVVVREDASPSSTLAFSFIDGIQGLHL